MLAFPLMIFAQTSDKFPTTVQVSVGEITDNRSTSFNSECTVELKFTGDVATDAASVREVRLQEATDEVGRDLMVKENDNMSSRFFDSGHNSGALKADVKLRNPSRNATTIKVLKGEVELFSPTEANGGVLTIKNILAHPAEGIQNAELDKYGVQLMYLTKEAYEAKKKEIAAQQKAGTDAFGELFRGMFGGMGMMSDSKNAVLLYVKDPQKRVLGLKFVDAQGNALKTRQSWSSNEFRSTDFEAAPPADTQLIIQLATPESVKSYPFKVENIPLP